MFISGFKICRSFGSKGNHNIFSTANILCNDTLYKNPLKPFLKFSDL